MQTPNANGHTNLITNGACFGCTIGCGRICHIDPQHFSVKDRQQYHHASGGLEYETAYALGAAVGVDDMDAATFAVVSSTVVDPVGNLNTVTFSDFETNKGLPDKGFDFTPPAGVRVIEDKKNSP